MADPPVPVKIPLVNANEPEALIASLDVSEGQHVSAGETLCMLETTKATSEILAEREGYVAGLAFQAGQTARAGAVLCYLAGSPGWKPPQAAAPVGDDASDALPEGLRITQPALAFARRNGLDLAQLPRGPLVTEGMVQEQLQKQPALARAPIQIRPELLADPNAILIYGGGGHSKMLIDLLGVLGAHPVAGILDDGLPPGQEVLGVPVLGGGDLLPELHRLGLRQAANAVGGIGDIQVRIKVFRRLEEAGFAFPTLVHPSAYVEPSARLAPGAQVLAKAYVGSLAQIGFGAIINTGAIVSHDCRLESYTVVSPGALLAGEVRLGEGALIGMGVTVNLGVSIGARARLGNSATVKADVPENGIVRAGKVWPE